MVPSVPLEPKIDVPSELNLMPQPVYNAMAVRQAKLFSAAHSPANMSTEMLHQAFMKAPDSAIGLFKECKKSIQPTLEAWKLSTA